MDNGHPPFGLKQSSRYQNLLSLIFILNEIYLIRPAGFYHYRCPRFGAGGDHVFGNLLARVHLRQSYQKAEQWEYEDHLRSSFPRKCRNRLWKSGSKLNHLYPEIFAGKDAGFSFGPISRWSGQSYRVRLTEGALTEDGRAIRKEMQALIQVRLPEVVFMSPVTGDPEIWISSIEPAVLRPVTQTGGSVYDFGVTPDGEHIIYSARNEMEGLDLWMIDRQGANKRLLLDCGPDWCSNPALSPDGARLAYARRNATCSREARLEFPVSGCFQLNRVKPPLYTMIPK
jgi:hypothetical protein